MNIHEKNTSFRVKIDSSNNNSNTVLENSKMFCIPKIKGFGMKSFAYNGCTLWNALPQNAWDAKTVSSFKDITNEHILILCKCVLFSLFLTNTV